MAGSCCASLTRLLLPADPSLSLLLPLLRLPCCPALRRAVQYPDDEESLAAALDELLDNPDFLDAVADELMYQVGRDVRGCMWVARVCGGEGRGGDVRGYMCVACVRMWGGGGRVRQLR